MALDEMVRHKRAEVAARQAERPAEVLRQGLFPTDRSLEAALRRPHTGFILECKTKSPSEGVLRPVLDPADVAAAYGPHADAISVLTDARFFGGSLERLTAIRALVHQPILCKDIVVDPYQVFEARAAGADAILLMLSVLNDDEYASCRAAAGQAGLEVVTEVHDEDQVDRAVAAGARIIGINNRDLRTLTVDRDVTARLAPRINPNRVIVAESGYDSHEAIREARGAVDAFLVGSALMRQPDLADATRALIFGRTKVCGLTRAEDAATAATLGATHGGLIFAPESPRAVDDARAAELRAAAPSLRWVGVFVNAPIEEVVRRATAHDLAAVQLHGEETPDEVGALRREFNGTREVWKAVRVRDRVPRVAETGADRLVLDSHDDRQRGGTGKRFNWALLDGHPDLDRIVLGGGLAPESVAAAEALGAWALDVNSGVERGPGRKDPVRMAEFFDIRRGLARHPATRR